MIGSMQSSRIIRHVQFKKQKHRMLVIIFNETTLYGQKVCSSEIFAQRDASRSKNRKCSITHLFRCRASRFDLIIQRWHCDHPRQCFITGIKGLSNESSESRDRPMRLTFPKLHPSRKPNIKLPSSLPPPQPPPSNNQPKWVK